MKTKMETYEEIINKIKIKNDELRKIEKDFYNQTYTSNEKEIIYSEISEILNIKDKLREEINLILKKKIIELDKDKYNVENLKIIKDIFEVDKSIVKTAVQHKTYKTAIIALFESEEFNIDVFRKFYEEDRKNVEEYCRIGEEERFEI